MRILINTPYLTLLGGVANHYIGLRPYWNEKVFYNQIGKRCEKSGSGIYWFPFDIIKFIIKIIFLRPDYVVLNPSLGKSAIKRDFVFLNITKIFKKKVVVFFHGFNTRTVEDMNVDYLKVNLNKCECVLVLAKEFSDIVKSWGVIVPIHLTTTKVDDRLIEGFGIETKDFKTKNILFLARIEIAKGIYTALDTIKILQEKDAKFVFRVVGSGSQLENAKKYALEKKIKVAFLGNLSGNLLKEEFKNANIYILPTHYEGMPTSVLEAMAFGLPVVSRPVGGLCDFFENGKMGQLVDGFNPQEFAEVIEKYLSNPVKVEESSRFNYEYAQKNFMASSVAKRIEEILKEY